jgi:predicted acetyltransferase
VPLPTDPITLRSPASDEELQAFYAPLAAAFGEDISPAEVEAERPLLELDRLVNAFDGDRRVGSAGSIPFELSVPGGSIARASGITAVGVVPDQRRRGILRRMMRWLFDDAARRGEPLAILWASEGAIYQRFGFGMGTLVSSFEVDRARVVFRDPLPPRDDVRIRMVDTEEGARIGAQLYDRVRLGIPGSLSRPDAMWRNLLMADAEWMRGGNGHKHRVVIEVAGEPRGYAIYRQKGDWDARGPNDSLLVQELLALDPDVEQYLWQWLASMDLVIELKAFRGPVPHPLQLRVLEPRRLGVRTGDGLWLRILDLPAALAARGYGGTGSLVLDVRDDVVESNAGRWRLEAGDGGAEVRPADAGETADLELDIADLAAVYLGAWRFADLVRVGRVRERRDGAAWDGDRLFLTPTRPFANTMF